LTRSSRVAASTHTHHSRGDYGFFHVNGINVFVTVCQPARLCDAASSSRLQSRVRLATTEATHVTMSGLTWTPKPKKSDVQSDPNFEGMRLRYRWSSMLTSTDIVRDSIRRALALIPHNPEPFPSIRTATNWVEGVLEWRRFNYGSFKETPSKKTKDDIRRSVAERCEEEGMLIIDLSLRSQPSHAPQPYRPQNIPGMLFYTWSRRAGC
jgi:hypothetical protein